MTSYRWIGGSGTYTLQGNQLPDTGPPGEDDQATIAQSGALVTDGGGRTFAAITAQPIDHSRTGWHRQGHYSHARRCRGH